MSTNLTTNYRWTTVRDAIRTELLTISSVVLVHPFLRWDGNLNNNEQRFLKKFQPLGANIINAWTISRLDQTKDFLTNRETLVRTLVAMNFWYSLDDDKASNDTFDNIVDDVVDHFDEPIRLSGAVEIQGPVNIAEEDFRFFGTKLVHHAELQTIAQHRVFTNQFR